MLHSDLFSEFGCDGELIELPERCTQLVNGQTLREVLDRVELGRR